MSDLRSHTAVMVALLTSSGGCFVVEQPAPPLLAETLGAGGAGGAGPSRECNPGENRPCSTSSMTDSGNCVGVQTCDATGTWLNGCDMTSECLEDPAPVVRYFIDEGEGATLNDSGTGTPLPLSIVVPMPPATLIWVNDGMHNGLKWDAGAEDGGMAHANLVGSGDKLVQGLGGVPQITIEVVLNVSSESTAAKWILSIGRLAPSDGDNHALALQESGGNAKLLLGDTEIASTTMTHDERIVMHAVLEGDHVLLYENGNLTVDAMHTMQTIPILSDDVLVLGNKVNQDKPLDGVLYYAALYLTALDAMTIEQHADLLMSEDDGGGGL